MQRYTLLVSGETSGYEDENGEWMMADEVLPVVDALCAELAAAREASAKLTTLRQDYNALSVDFYALQGELEAANAKIAWQRSLLVAFVRHFQGYNGTPERMAIIEAAKAALSGGKENK
jgi:hypothetical protein